MELSRKFYMPDGDQTGGGPTERDLDNAERLNATYSEMRNTLRSIGFSFKEEINEQVEHMDEITGKVVKNIGENLNREIQDSIKLTRILSDAEKGVGKSLTSQVKVKSEIRRVEERRKLITDLINEAENEGLFLTTSMKRLQADVLKQLEDQEKALQKQLASVKRFEERLGSLGNILTGISKIPVIGQFIKADDILRRMKETAEEGGSKMKVFGEGAKALFSGLGTTLLGLIIPALRFIVDSVTQFNQKAFDLAKNLGTSADQGERLVNQFTQIANTSANAGLMGKEIAKTYAEISNNVGYLVDSSREFAETATLIQKRTGASAESMAALAMQSALTGKTLQQTYKTIEASRVIEGARNKLSLTTRQIMDGIAKTSATVVVNFKNSTEALSNAIIRATKLGTTLNDINKQAESLVDFESSIQKEFELQVLTGRDVNLTRARELALLGDTAGLMEELNRQQVTYDKFQTQTIIERKAEAEALGMSVEELSKKLLLQKQATELGAKEGESLQETYNRLIRDKRTREEIAGIVGKNAEQDLYRASIQERFQAAMERFKDTLGSILQGPVGDMLISFSKFVGDTQKMTKLGNTLKGIFESISNVIKNFPSILSATVGVLKVIASLSIASAVARIVASLSTVPVVGAAAGVVAGVAAYNWMNGLVEGISAGAPSVATPSATTAAMTQPVSTAATAYSNTGTQDMGTPTNTSNVTSTAKSGVGDVYLDSTKVGKIIFNTSGQLHLNQA